MIRLCQGQGSFTNAFSLKALNLKIFAHHEGIYIHLKIKPGPDHRIMEVFILEVKRLKRLRHVQPELDIY